MPASITRWDPFADLADFRTRLARAFEEDGRERPWSLALDVTRDDGNMVVRADVPGMTPDEVKIELEDDVLTISGEHEEEKEEKGKEYVRRERRYGSFSRSVTLPAGVKAEDIKATTRDGVLELVIPMPEEPRKEKVQITPTAG
jgi:HSP20 family protein